MPAPKQLSDYLESSEGKSYLAHLYGNSPEALASQTKRYQSLLKGFAIAFPQHTDMDIFSSPGRSEVGGNHTDHNAGRILAAAVDLDIIAAVARNNSDLIVVHSEGYSPAIVNIHQTGVVEEEKYSATSLVRGVCARFQQLGLSVGGFDAVATSKVPKGSGLSSSAAYEVLIATILNHLFNAGKLDPVLVAQISQYAENQYFGKPCGLMDQTTCSVGGFVTIDFNDFNHPVVRKLDYDFATSGYSMVIVDTAGDHADLNDEYEALEYEMKSVARALGGQVLREFSMQKVLENVHYLRERVSDRAILRAINFYGDDQRVVDQVRALEANQFERFLQLVIESGESSWLYCQNCYSPKSLHRQGISIALMVSEALLKGRGAWRVHGGGFAGTIQVFVPNDLLTAYLEQIERIFGHGSGHIVLIRPEGSIRMAV